MFTSAQAARPPFSVWPEKGKRASRGNPFDGFPLTTPSTYDQRGLSGPFGNPAQNKLGDLFSHSTM